MSSGQNIKGLLLSVDASTELLRRELVKASAYTDDWAANTRRRAAEAEAAVAKGASAAILSMGKWAAGYLTLGQAALSVVNSTREMERLNAQLITATGSAEGAAASFDMLSRFAEKTPFSLTEITEAFIRLRNLGIDPTEERLTAFGNISSAMGKTIMQFAEAVADAASGEMERLREFGIKAAKDGEQVAFTFRGVTTTVKNSAEEITRYLTSIGTGQFAGAMDRQMSTMDGALSNLGDKAAKLGRTLGGLGVSSLAIGTINTLTRALNDAANVAERLGKALLPTSMTSDRLTAARASYQSLVERRMKAEKAKEEGGFLNNTFGGGNTFNVKNLRAQEAKAFAEYTAAWNESQAAAPGAAVTGGMAGGDSKGKKKKGSSAKKKAPSWLSQARAGDFDTPMPEQDLTIFAELPVAQVSLDEMQATLEAMQALPPIKPVDEEGLWLLQSAAADVSASIAQAVVEGGNLGDALVGSAKRFLMTLAENAIFNLLFGGLLGGTFLGGIFGGRRSSGGPVEPGVPYLVGENSPEIFIPTTRGRIAPTHGNAGGAGGAGGGEPDRLIVDVRAAEAFDVRVQRVASNSGAAAAVNTIGRAVRPTLPASRAS